uniref:Interferon-induced very large GTPase 1-like n=1 Tax=Ictidomys tridecemlineatus TaxID=43179 RepID=A0A287DG48_ICTTR|nr:interferon-induced very large GTPase 1-like [Ictidomys tridecemlineatus]
MDTSEQMPDEPLLRSKRKQDLPEMLREVGLEVEYWLIKLKEVLGVTCAQSLSYLKEKDLQKLKYEVKYPWEQRALEKLLDLSHSNSLAELQESPLERKKEKQTEQAVKEIRNMLSERRQRQEEAVKRKEAELRQAMEIPEENRLKPPKPLREIMEIMKKELSPMEQMPSNRPNLPDRDLVRWSSGGLALQGIYKTCHHMDLIQRREELLSVPKEFSLLGPQQGTLMKSEEFTSSQAEVMFTQSMENLGFSLTTSAKGGGWGFSLETELDKSKHSESKQTHLTNSECSYFCSTKFRYTPMASCHFPIDQLQLSNAALQELKCLEDLMDQTTDSQESQVLKHWSERFFHRFGSHANQGPLHLGGIYWWKAVSKWFQNYHLVDIKQQAIEALDFYISGGYHGFGMNVAAGMNVSDSHSKAAIQNKTFQNLQTKFELSVSKTGGPPEADDLAQWKAGLVASNQTWCVIDRGFQLVPIWDIILSSHRSDFKDPCKVAKCLKDNYTALTGLTSQIQEGEEILSVRQEVRVFLDAVKSWEVSDPEEHLQKLINFKQTLSQKTKVNDTWINLCLTDKDLQTFLVNTINFCKMSTNCKTNYIKIQLCSLLDPHIYKVENFPQTHSIMHWIKQSDSEQEQVHISRFPEFIENLTKTHKEFLEVKVQEKVEEAQRKATYEVCLALNSFLSHLQATEQPDTQLLLLSIAAGAGYQVGSNIFKPLLGPGELNFLLDEMKTAFNEYQKLKSISSYRAHAFLVLTGLTATAELRALSTEEKTKCMEFIIKHMGQLFSKEVVHVLTRFEEDYDWENLERNLRLLIDGDYEATISSLKRDDVERELLKLFHENKWPCEPDINENNTNEEIDNEAFLDLLQRLGLQHYYPKKMSKAKFHLIYKTSLYNTQPNSEKELPFYFLQKLMLLDYGLRYLVFKDYGNRESKVSPSASSQEYEGFDPYEDFVEDSDTLTDPLTTESRPHIHPMDIQMTIFHCADDFARQYILTKLSTCQFALPLLVPNPCTSQIEFSLWSLRKVRRSWQQEKKSPHGKNSHKCQQMCCLATFVIGLANLTLINIFGENPSEMQDILQIAVQAFLRMKQVKISPRCIFVHQNVGEVTAKDQTTEGRRRLEQRLDEMAALAAKQEECSDVTHFSDVIKFDVNNHVYYFAHLWDGNPPMAPPNPRYSHNVQELKSTILLTAKQESKGSIMKISDVKFRVQDLWRALVSENFIFSFRNTREVMAMSKLETMYNHWTWELRSHMLDLQNQLHNQIQNRKILTLTSSIIECPVTEKYETIKQVLEKYFTEDPEREILVQWKAYFENKLLILKESLISDTKRKAHELIHLKKNQEQLEQKKTVYENELLKKSQNLALRVKGKKLSDEELYEKFSQLWGKWVCEVSSNLPQATEPKIDVHAENILLDYFRKEKNIVEKLKRNIGKNFQLDFGKHVKMCKGVFFTKSLEACDKVSIDMTTDRIFSRFNEYIENITNQQRDYDQSDFHQILRIIEEEGKSEHTKNRYTFTSEYNIELSSYLFQKATKDFMERHWAFRRANDPVKYLEQKKDDFFMSFKISCQGATSITCFVDFLWQKLTPAVSATIQGKMVPRIAGEIRASCPAFNGNRSNLEKHILISLAEEENFENYWQYIYNPKSFCRSYIENYTKKYCSENRDKKMKTLFKTSLDDIKNTILSAIHESTAVAKDRSSTASGWLDLFCDHLGNNLIFPRRDLINIEHQEIKDMDFLKEAMSASLDPAMKKVEQNLSSMPIEEMVPEIEKILSEHLCGCWKQCPFCNAICTNTIPEHDGDHSVPFHRPQAVSGGQWYRTDHFVIDCCTSLVASNNLLVLRDDWMIPFKNYREVGGDYATWSITPDSSTQPYWKWFVCHFRTKLEEKYQLKFIDKGQIPYEWDKITKQEVLNDLKK